MLRESSGALRLIDLEYFGWDDPAKLVSDFCWHPGMTLSQKLRDEWVRATTEIYSRDQSFVARLHATHPLYGLRWAMIVLNPFLDRIGRNPESTKILYGQLEKSDCFCNRVADWIRNAKYSY